MISEIIAQHIWGRTITVAVPDLKSRFDVARDILTPFGIPVTPSDEKDSKKTEQDGLTELHELGLPTYTYAQMVDRIVGEIRRRDKFVLN